MLTYRSIKKPLTLAALVLLVPPWAYAASAQPQAQSHVRSACAQVFANGECMYGQQASDAEQHRVVDTAKVRSLVVTYGETVEFVHEGQVFVWTFDGLGDRSFPLSAIASRELGGHDVMIYVQPDWLHER